MIDRNWRAMARHIVHYVRHSISNRDRHRLDGGGKRYPGPGIACASSCYVFPSLRIAQCSIYDWIVTYHSLSDATGRSGGIQVQLSAPGVHWSAAIDDVLPPLNCVAAVIQRVVAPVRPKPNRRLSDQIPRGASKRGHWSIHDTPTCRRPIGPIVDFSKELVSQARVTP